MGNGRSAKRTSLALAVIAGALTFLPAPVLAARKKAPDGQRAFQILMDSRKIGRETYTREKNPEKGIERIEAQASVFLGGRQTHMRQSLDVEAGTLALKEYHLEATVAGMKQEICVCGVDEKVHLEVKAGVQDLRKDLDTPADLIILDNLVANHYELLLGRYDWEKGGRQSFHAVVPQVMQIVPLTAEATGAPQGSFEGRPVTLRHLRVIVSGLVVEVLSSPDVPGRLLAVHVPLQKLEMVREGFEVGSAGQEAEPADVTERELDLVNGKITLGGTLTLPPKLPKKRHSLPAVVLVHGSGPNDRDETIGPNKPFRDLARDLARLGLAVYRYDKRTFAAKDSLDVATITLEEETIADAAAALRLVGKQKNVDPKRVYLAGHSLGGFAAPWIAEQEPSVAGIILLAGANRPLDEMMIEQSLYLAGRRGVEEQAREKVEAMREQFRKLRAGELPEDAVVVGAGVHYWKDILARDPPSLLGKLSQPILVLRGAKDYQVGADQYQRWLDACRKANKDNCSGTVFEDLNHLFMPVEGVSDGTEYQVPGHVSPELAKRIAEWILGRPSVRQ